MQGLIEKCQQNGLEQIIKSWIGTGENLPISASQILDIFGQLNLDTAAEKLVCHSKMRPIYCLSIYRKSWIRLALMAN